jgi:hypothetical protein
MSRVGQVLEQLALALPPPSQEGELPPLPDTPFPEQIFSPPMEALIEKLRSYVRQDVFGYLPPKNDAEAASQSAQERADRNEALNAASESAASAAIAAALHGAPDAEGEAEDPPENNEEEPEEEVTTATVLEAGMVIEEQGNKYLNSIAERLGVLQPPELPDTLALDVSVAKNLSPAELLLYNRLAHQTALLSDPDHSLEVPLGILQRIKQALSAIAQGRAVEGYRILKTARQLDVRSAALAFFISQLAYYRAHQGARDFLPEAREEGYRAASAIDALPAESVQYYRYIQVCCERALSEQRAIELMREHYLLSPETLAGSEGGMLGRDGIAIKTLLLLATIDMSHWTRFEFSSLADIAKHTCGGLVFYIALFRPKIRERQQGGQELIFEQQSELEHQLTLLYQSYEAVRQSYRTEFNTSTGLPRMAGTLPWCVQARYLQVLLKAGPLPTFGEILWHISLDGRRVIAQGYPNNALMKAGISHITYWQAWNIALRPSASERRERIPCVEVARMGQALHLCGILLDEIMVEENAQVSFNKWQLAEPHLAPITYNQLCNMRRKVAVPEGLLGPRDPFYKPCYRTWLPLNPAAKRASDLIRVLAQNGSFSDIYEAVDALTAAAQLLNDPVYGLVPRVEEALRTRVHGTLDGYPNNHGDKSGLGISNHFSEFWWFYFLVMPTAVLTFITIVAMGTYASGIKLLGVLVGIFAFGGFFFYRMNQGKQTKD